VFGIASRHSQDELRQLINTLESNGLLAVSGGQYPTLQVTPQGRAFLKARDTLHLSRPIAQNNSHVYRDDSDAPLSNRAARRDRGRTSGSDDTKPYDADLFRELSALRKRIADQQGVPTFVVFGDRSLREMARQVPLTRHDFAQISGVGEAKLREFSGPFIGTIKSYVGKHGLPQPDSEGPEPRPAKKPTSYAVGNTFLETARLVSAGASLTEVAGQRGLSENTIVGHLERLVQDGETVAFDHLLPNPQRQETIRAAFDALGHELLRPVFDELGGEYTYDELRLVRIGLCQK
jgi:ATP-dependent DNA helicase RecQ